MDHLESSISPRRADLLARLAAERSFLLQQLEGLDEATLTHDPVFGGWTAAGLLAHLAYWDALTADWLSKLADGRPGDIRAAGIVDGSLDTRNADMQRRFAGLPFAQGVALCQKERRGLLLALQRLPDNTLQQRVYLDTGHRATPAHWLRRRYRHDASHAADLARWRANYSANDPATPLIHRALLRPLLGLARAEFLALAALVPPGERETWPIAGDWSLKQVLGHLSDYERLGVVALRQVAAGHEPTYEQTIEDYEGFNAERGPIWAALPWAEVWAHYVATRRALLEVALTLGDAALARPFVAPDLETTTACGYLLDMAGHEQEHADALRGALGLPALPRRLGRAGG